MGLDISYYSNLKKLGKKTGGDEDHDNLVICNAECFTYQLGSMGSDYLYETTDNEYKSFPAGSYGTYNRWREHLSIMAGYDNTNAVWEDFDMVVNEIGYVYKEMKPFYEIIAFSDCEGMIGPEVSAKLHKDFVDFDKKAKKYDDGILFSGEHFYNSYCNWKEAFRVASENGAVAFH